MYWQLDFPPCRRRVRQGWRAKRSLLAAAAVLVALAASSSQTHSQPAHANSPARAAETACPPDAIRVWPSMSIQAAVDLGGPGASFCITAGIYRLQSVAPKTGQKFFGEPGSVLNGAQVLRHFEREGNMWVAPGQTQVGIKRGDCAKTHPACALSAGFFIDDKPLEQVVSKAELAPNRFFFDHAAGRIYFVDDPTGKLVEATATRFAFKSKADEVLIKGLVIEKYYNPAQDGAVHGEEGKGWRVERTELRFNSGVGVGVGTNGAIVGCRIHHNGQMGATAADMTNILVEGNEIFANNIYGFDSHWEAGGVKITNSSRVTFRGNHVRDNAGPGLWCDINCRDIIYEGNTVEYNFGPGIFHEISYAAIIRNNKLRENGQAKLPWFWDAEIQVAASQDVEIHGNTVTVRPGGRSIMLIDQNRDREGGGYYKTQHNRVHHNDITFLGSSWTGGVTDAHPGQENYFIIENGGNHFDHNTYRVPHGVRPQFVWGKTSLDFTGFQDRGQERNGTVLTHAKSSE
jgi:parallel beta-helix repeat protein